MGYNAWESFRRFVKEADEQYQRFATTPLIVYPAELRNDAEMVKYDIEQAQWLLHEHAEILQSAMEIGEYVPGKGYIEQELP
jgi:hypothetical protein